jgi:hypothetical protein
MHDLGVVGLVFFEVFVPAEAAWPPPGEEHFVDALPVGLGGALNTASVARALGLDVALISPRGGGLTDLAIAARVAALGLHDLPWPAPSDGAITLVRSTPHDRAFLSAIAPGTLAGCPPLPAARWIHVGGLGEAELLADRLAEARAAGARVSVSAGWDPPRLAALRARLEAGSTTPPWDLFFANAREAEALVGTAEGAEHQLAGRVAHRRGRDVWRSRCARRAERRAVRRRGRARRRARSYRRGRCVRGRRDRGACAGAGAGGVPGAGCAERGAGAGAARGRGGVRAWGSTWRFPNHFSPVPAADEALGPPVARTCAAFANNDDASVGAEIAASFSSKVAIPAGSDTARRTAIAAS